MGGSRVIRKEEGSGRVGGGGERIERERCEVVRGSGRWLEVVGGG